MYFRSNGRRRRIAGPEIRMAAWLCSVCCVWLQEWLILALICKMITQMSSHSAVKFHFWFYGVCSFLRIASLFMILTAVAIIYVIAFMAHCWEYLGFVGCWIVTQECSLCLTFLLWENMFLLHSVLFNMISMNGRTRVCACMCVWIVNQPHFCWQGYHPFNCRIHGSFPFDNTPCLISQMAPLLTSLFLQNPFFVLSSHKGSHKDVSLSLSTYWHQLISHMFVSSTGLWTSWGMEFVSVVPQLSR